MSVFAVGLRVAVPSALLGWAVVLTGCAGAPREPQSGVDAKARESKSEKDALPPLTPVSAPDGVVGRLRVKNPAALADDALEAFAIPLDWRKKLAEDTHGEAFEIVDFEGSVEGALAMDPAFPQEPFRVLSWGVVGIEEALAFFDREQIAVNEVRGGKYRFVLDDSPCLLGRALGSSPARIVCSDQTKSLPALGDYALRGMATEELSDAAVHAQMDFRPVQERYGKELRRARLIASMAARTSHVGHPRYDRALTDAALGITDEAIALLDDLETIQAQFYSEKSGAFRTKIRARFEDNQSKTAQMLLHLQKKQDFPPVAFGRLPGDVGSASYSREVSSAVAEPWMSVFVDLAAGWFESQGASLRFSDRVASLLRLLGPKGADSLNAEGLLSSSEEQGMQIWHAYGTTREKKEVVQVFEDLSWLLASKELSKLFPLATELGAQPRIRKVWKKVPQFPGAVVFEWDLALDAEAESSLLTKSEGEHGEPDLNEVVKSWLDGLVAVHEFGGVTWLAWSSESSFDELRATFAAIQKEGKKLEDGELASALFDQKAVGGGFVSLDGMAHSLSNYVKPPVLARWSKVRALAPNRGQVPMTYFFTVKSGEVTEAQLDWTVPEKFTQDVSTVAALLIAEFGLSAFGPGVSGSLGSGP